MDTQTRNMVMVEDTPGLAYCGCCAPRQLLIPRDDVGQMGRWAVCVATGAWYEDRGDGVWVTAPAPRQGEILPAGATAGLAAIPARPDAWAGGDALPVIVPGVRIDLSKESYA